MAFASAQGIEEPSLGLARNSQHIHHLTWSVVLLTALQDSTQTLVTFGLLLNSQQAECSKKGP
jgi:hypothetical protein